MARSPLFDIILDAMNQNDGSISFAEYMGLCLSHPEYGYYMTRDPFGVDGDFTTAPEISQMFGELIGLWLVTSWRRFGSSTPFSLLECGPGRGTLMADALRAAGRIDPAFIAAMRLFLLEMSPTLKKIQKKKLHPYAPVWLNSLSDLQKTVHFQGPLFFVANEFLDALPVHQLRLNTMGCFERRVIHRNGTFQFFDQKADSFLISLLPSSLRDGKVEGIIEVSPVMKDFLETLCSIIKKNRGAGVFFDYGTGGIGFGDTLQAVRSHRFVSLWESPGDADITAHVSFGWIEAEAKKAGIWSSPCVCQGDFLRRMGINARAQALMGRAEDAKKDTIKTQMNRLTDAHQMGSLFKVMALQSESPLFSSLAGFSDDVEDF